VRTTESTTAESAARACSGRFAASFSRPWSAATICATETFARGLGALRASCLRSSESFASSNRPTSPHNPTNAEIDAAETGNPASVDYGKTPQQVLQEEK